MNFRVGLGYDTHKLVVGRKLIIGGVLIPFEKGLLGHSDADVLLHSIADALLGAACLGDIGKHFPDSSKAYSGISSLEILKSVGKLIAAEGYLIENIDSVVIAERPKISEFTRQMENNIALSLAIGHNKVNVKATTEEGLGFVGSGEGISAKAICLISKNK